MAVAVQDKKTNAGGVSILDKTIMLIVAFSSFGNRKKASMAAVDVNAEKSYLALSKRLLKSKEFDAIKSIDREVRAYLAAIALPFNAIRNGSYLIPIPVVETVEAALVGYAAQRTALVEAFCSVYPAQVEAVASELRDVYNAKDYPSVDALRELFAIDWEYMDYGVSGRLKSIDAAMFEAARVKMEKKIENATEVVQQTLRAALLKMTAHLVEQMQPTEEGGKRKVLRDAAIKNVQAFLETFDVRNITNDKELAAVVKQARELISGVDRKALKDDEALKAAVLTGFTKINDSMNGLITEKTRRIQFDDEPDGGGDGQ
jgi:hypothetical protein